MKTRSRITKLIAITMAVAAMAAASLLCGAGWLQPVEAQGGDGTVRFVSYTTIGIGHGQKVRLTVGSTEESDTNRFVYMYYTVSSPSGAPLYESERIRVPPGGFESSEVSREDLNTEGDPENGRAELLVKTVMEAPAGSNPAAIHTSYEAVWDEHGAVCLDVPRNIPTHEVGHILGIMPEHRLSYGVFNPNEEGSEPVSVRAYVYDKLGRLARQTDPVVLRPGELRRLDFDYDDLPLAGEPGTGRKLMRTVIKVVSTDGSERPVKRPVSMELVEKRTGRTQVGDYILLTGNTVEL